MKAKAYLNQVQKLNKMIQNKIIEKDQWQQMAASIGASPDGEKVQASGKPQKMADAVCRYIELEKQIDNDIDRLIAIKKDVIATIECLNAYEYDVLHIVYIQGKTLHDVADYYGRSYSWILSIHRAALKHVQDILDAEQRQRIESMCKSV